MDRAERQRILDFIDDYDHGRTANDIKVPEFVIEQLRGLTNEAHVTDAFPCAQCGAEATWTIHERFFCTDHPDDSGNGSNGVDDLPLHPAHHWRARYERLTSTLVQAEQLNSVQELRARMREAVAQDAI